MPVPNLPIKTGHVFIGLAVIMGVATVGIFSGGKKEVKPSVQKVETQSVVVPLVQINQGQALSMNDVTTVKWPSAFVPRGAVFTDSYKVIGRVAKQTLFPGEPIFMQKVSGSEGDGGLPAMIPQGMRAVTIAVSEVKGVAGFVKPGDRVDVMSTFELEREGADALKMTKTVLQNVLVLASAQNMVKDGEYNIETPQGVTSGEASMTAESDQDKKADKKKKESPQDIEKKMKERQKEKEKAAKAAKLVSSVTLAVTPEQSEALALAEESGDLRLALRPDTDNNITNLDGINSETLLGTAPPRAPRAADFTPPSAPAVPPAMPPAAFMGTQVEFIQGTDKTMYNF